MSLSPLQLRVLELHEQGLTPKEISKKVHRMTKEVVAILELRAKRPDLQYGMKGLRDLAKDAGLIK
jgi:transcriptional regulator